MQPEQPDTNTDEVPTVQPVRAARKPARMTRAVCAALLAVAVALTGIFVAARYINPYDADGTPRTSATHTQLGMPPCNFKLLTDKGCPSCGMTTSFALLMRGDLMSSLRANWVGTTICVIWAVTLVWALASGLWGRALLIPRRRGAGEMIFTAVTSVVVVLMLVRWGVILIRD